MRYLLILLFPFYLMTFDLFTEDNPPLSYIDKLDNISGTAVEIVRAILKEYK